MRKTHLLHITPELPPTVGGIADYTAILSRRLVEVSEGNVSPTLIRAGWKDDGPTPETEFNTVDCAGECNPAALARTIRDHADSADRIVVVLQYSGYGYAPRGAPWWLVRGLQQACEEASVPLITMFHELYATGPPWTSAFWLSPAQRYIAARLARMSQAVVTNRAKSADWLRRYVASDIPVHVQPVFSNVGKPNEVLPYEERDSYAVVFGNSNKKARLYRALKPTHIRQIKSVGVKQIVDVGTSGGTPSSLHGLSIEAKGIQPVEAIRTLFGRARTGLLSYPVDYLTKSGIWSSYVAHGMLPLVLSPHRDTEEIKEGSHFIRIREEAPPIAPSEAQRVAATAHQWYKESASSKSAARTFIHLIEQACLV